MNMLEEITGWGISSNSLDRFAMFLEFSVAYYSDDDDPDFMSFRKNVIRPFIDCIIIHGPVCALTYLRRSPRALLVEPIVVAALMMIGEDPRAPHEIKEVANDIVKEVKAAIAAKGGAG